MKIDLSCVCLTGERAPAALLPQGLRCRWWLSLTVITRRCGASAGTSPALYWPPLEMTAVWDSGKVSRQLDLLPSVQRPIQIRAFNLFRSCLSCAYHFASFKCGKRYQVPVENSVVYETFRELFVTVSVNCAANYMDNWKCTGILRGDGSPVNSSGHAAALNAVGVSAAGQLLVGAASAGRYVMLVMWFLSG